MHIASERGEVHPEQDKVSNAMDEETAKDILTAPGVLMGVPSSYISSILDALIMVDSIAMFVVFDLRDLLISNCCHAIQSTVCYTLIPLWHLNKR